MSKIVYTDKVDKTGSSFAEINKVTADNMNEIKDSVNALYDTGGGFVVQIKTATYTALISDDLIITDSAVTLYAASTAVQPINIKNDSLSSIIITPDGSDTIEGESTATILAGNSHTYFPSGTNFLLI